MNRQFKNTQTFSNIHLPWHIHFQVIHGDHYRERWIIQIRRNLKKRVKALTFTLLIELVSYKGKGTLKHPFTKVLTTRFRNMIFKG